MNWQEGDAVIRTTVWTVASIGFIGVCATSVIADERPRKGTRDSDDKQQIRRLSEQLEGKFRTVDENFGNLDSRLKRVEGNSSELHEVLTDLSRKLDKLTTRVDGLDNRLERLESQRSRSQADRNLSAPRSSSQRGTNRSSHRDNDHRGTYRDSHRGHDHHKPRKGTSYYRSRRPRRTSWIDCLPSSYWSYSCYQPSYTYCYPTTTSYWSYSYSPAWCTPAASYVCYPTTSLICW